MMKLGIGFTQETAEVSNPLLAYTWYRHLGIILRSTCADYVLCGNGVYSLSNIESSKSKCCHARPRAWVPACGALVYTYLLQKKLGGRFF